jgi:hypothetical protein
MTTRLRLFAICPLAICWCQSKTRIAQRIVTGHAMSAPESAHHMATLPSHRPIGWLCRPINWLSNRK